MKYYIILIALFIVLFILYLIFVRKLRIKWHTLITRGFRPSRANFGLYTYTGNQGKGKTYSLIEYIYDNQNDCFFFTNIQNITCLDYYKVKEDTNANAIYYKGFDGLIKCKEYLDRGLYDSMIKDKQVVFIFDELFTELTRGTKLSLQVQDFLCQLRKRKIIFLTTAQVWPEIPLYFRRLCRFQINCNMFPFLKTGFLIKEFNDAENMKWDEELQEHVAPTLELSFSKVRRVISSCYDTRERIEAENIYSTSDKNNALKP